MEELRRLQNVVRGKLANAPSAVLMLPAGTRVGCSSFSTLMAMTFSASHRIRSLISKAKGRCPPSCVPTCVPLTYTVPK